MSINNGTFHLLLLLNIKRRCILMSGHAYNISHWESKNHLKTKKNNFTKTYVIWEISIYSFQKYDKHSVKLQEFTSKSNQHNFRGICPGIIEFQQYFCVNKCLKLLNTIRIVSLIKNQKHKTRAKTGIFQNFYKLQRNLKI